MLNNAMLVAFTADYREDQPGESARIDRNRTGVPSRRSGRGDGAGAVILTCCSIGCCATAGSARAIVAVRMDREAAALMGVDVKHINAVTFAYRRLHGRRCRRAARIIFPISPLNASLFLGKAFVVCVLGGLGSVPGAMVGGLVLGDHRKLRLVLVRSRARGDAVIRAAAGAAVRASERPPRADRATNERAGSSCSLQSRCCSRCLPLSGNNYILRLATTVCMYAVMAQSWNYIGGLAGYPSFATAAFFGFGAYTSAILQNHGVPMLAAWGSLVSSRSCSRHSSAAQSCICAATISRLRA